MAMILRIESYTLNYTNVNLHIWILSISIYKIHYGEHLNIVKSWEVELENKGWQGKFSRI